MNTDKISVKTFRRDIQLDHEGRLMHFLTIEGLDRPLLTEILDKAEGFISVSQQATKKLPLCRGKIVTNLFFRNQYRDPHHF